MYWRLKVEHLKFHSIKLLDENRKYLKDFTNKIKSGEKVKSMLAHSKVELIKDSNNTDFPKFWSCSGIPTISKKSLKVLEPIISEDVEVIPLDLSDKAMKILKPIAQDKNDIEHIPLNSDDRENDFYIINTLKAVDVIDKDESEFDILDSGLVIGIEKFIFNKIDINSNIFRVYLNDRVYFSEVFVSDEFKKVVERANLKGFKFVEVDGFNVNT